MSLFLPTRRHLLIGNPLLVSDRFSRGAGSFAAQFTAANSEYLSRADNADLSMGDIDFEVSFSCYLDSLPANNTAFALVGKWQTGDREWLVIVWTAAGVSTFQFYVQNTANTTNTFVNAATFGALSTGTWYHVRAYHDSVGNVIGIAVNNGAADTTAWTQGVRDGTAIFAIGQDQGAEYLNGRVDAVGVWKKVLSSAERTTVYNGGIPLQYAALSGSLLTSLVEYWDLDEASGNRTGSHAGNTLTDNNTVTQAIGPGGVGPGGAGLGTAETGQSWTAQSGTWDITSGQAYSVTAAGGDRVVLNAGASDYTIDCDLKWVTNADAWILLRLQDGSNFLQFGIDSAGALRLYKNIADAYTSLGNYALGASDGTTYSLRADARGSTISIYVDNVLRITATGVTEYQRETTIGFRMGNATAGVRWDNLQVLA